QIGSLNAVAPVANKSETVVFMARNWVTTIAGSANAYFSAGNWRLAAGREFSETEQRAGKTVCVIGETVRRQLFGAQSSLGVALRIRNFACEVIGVLAPKGQSAMGMDQDDIV
ncbi:ABC transporter permease, partial [Arthrospira platensis SPKY1]|nr:ABC transporter permease [Arthrospira platensis SPKY1]